MYSYGYIHDTKHADNANNDDNNNNYNKYNNTRCLKIRWMPRYSRKNVCHHRNSVNFVQSSTKGNVPKNNNRTFCTFGRLQDIIKTVGGF